MKMTNGETNSPSVYSHESIEDSTFFNWGWILESQEIGTKKQTEDDNTDSAGT